MTITYNKLVRDRIPEIIESSGKSCTTEILSAEEYLRMIDEKLDEHLAEIDHTCTERVELIMNQLARCEGVTEALKASDQLEWVRRINSIRARAEEIVRDELIFS